jgi:predicted RNA binding protein YcfA (HicA-like mRNA interferase family)
LVAGEQRFVERGAGGVGTLPAMTAREVEAILQRACFVFVRQTSHRIWQKGTHSVPVPAHRGTLKMGTLRSIIKYAGMSEDEFLALRD